MIDYIKARPQLATHRLGCLDVFITFLLIITFFFRRKMLVPLPSPLGGLICLGKLYLLLTSFYFVSMGNLLKATDGLDGLAGGIAALAFVAMAIVVLPICSG